MSMKTRYKADTSRRMTAELLRDVQQRNYGAAETKALELWHQANIESHAQLETGQAINEALDKALRTMKMNSRTRYIFLKELDYRIGIINRARKTAHSEGMRAGYMYARAICNGGRFDETHKDIVGFVHERIGEIGEGSHCQMDSTHGGNNMSMKTTSSVDTSRRMTTELLRDVQQRNYGAAETKALELWHILNEDAQAIQKTRNLIRTTLDDIKNARAIYKGTRK